eukprot:CAMPEP_0115248804 /NCGR_PEP_ID=MMETSP0270-20121206/42259_1 /TAXON_ID=71861 /ORGANISM="Scrippsiella trochoidea, Strain CCMP3099" /LENGTH=56 /DNA_ID=CAMNT_0002664117 /DNA_START=27 /DNA_END=194 /DNA_ORIENTATION=+
MIRDLGHMLGVHILEFQETEEGIVVDMQALLQQDRLSVFDGQAKVATPHSDHREIS